MVFVSCPVCGHKLIEGKTGSSVRLKCSKCGEIVKVIIDKEGVIVSPVHEKPKTALPP